MLGKHARDELRSAVRPPGSQIFHASPKRAFELAWQGRKEVLKELPHLAAHPFAGEILLTSQREDHAGAGKGAADIENARGFIKADRPIAAHDTKQGLAVDPDFPSDLVLRLVRRLDCMGKNVREAGVGFASEWRGLVHRQKLQR
ncbi:hypothetical protein [Novosphingobium naphthalenivorans]|jgi:hypothetical protein|uniref:hypothetical protein n=1 Tax=Novosphingobium naphthalenivorans TaxID=273168 RepID=UPI00157A2726|nr:hypothetical protein [Novosphingobium naphthalenivorans]